MNEQRMKEDAGTAREESELIGLMEQHGIGSEANKGTPTSYKGLHSTFAALLSYAGVVVRVRIPRFATHRRPALAVSALSALSACPPRDFHVVSAWWDKKAALVFLNSDLS